MNQGSIDIIYDLVEYGDKIVFSSLGSLFLSFDDVVLFGVKMGYWTKGNVRGIRNTGG